MFSFDVVAAVLPVALLVYLVHHGFDGGRIYVHAHHQMVERVEAVEFLCGLTLLIFQPCQRVRLGNALG